MVSNDLFRLVSLRQSERRSGDGNGGPPPEPRPRATDPRIAYRDVIEDQRKVESSPLEDRLDALKKRHTETARKIADLEAVQRGVVNAVMAERQVIPRDATAASLKTARPVAIRTGSRLSREIEGRLNRNQVGLYREVLRDLGGAADTESLLTGLALDARIVEANKYCAEIRAIEDDMSLDLPVGPSTPPEFRPSVVAVGWGDLIVARESLVGYDAREIAHIENILPGESKLREHSRLSRTEEVTETETVSERETEKDSQSTDRYELQAESQETIEREFRISAGVNTSGRYGLTKVDTSLDAAFAQTSSQSRSNSVETAREIVAKAVERTFESVRKLRRLTITEEIREINRHKLTNVGSPPPLSISGMYVWVEKIQRVELRHYGTRLMVEFHIPEPAVSLFEGSSRRKVRRRLPPFDVGPADVDFSNYMCLAQRFGAFDVDPPPAQFINVGYGWASTKSESDEGWAEDQFTAMINVPDGYRPEWAKVGWSALRGSPSEFNFAFQIGGVSQNIEHTVLTFDGVVLQLPPRTTWPNGVPVSARVHGHWDASMYVQATLSCVRTEEAVEAWRLRTWESLRVGYEALERKLAQEESKREFDDEVMGPVIAERPAAENRRIERGELQKWAIKSMRSVPQNFNAIEQVGEQQEMSPRLAEAQAPIVRFYEDAFEWREMTYFLYPYHWARRASWRMRSEARAVDHQFQAFLDAGAARVIVPVTPGYEDKVLAYLNPLSTDDELIRILAPPPNAAPEADDHPFRDVWIELLTERKSDTARGSGTLAVEHGAAGATISADSKWEASDRDVGRELYIDGDRYLVAAHIDAKTITLDRPYEGETDPAALYAAGSMPYGPPWTVNVPTTLVVLADNIPALREVAIQ